MKQGILFIFVQIPRHYYLLNKKYILSSCKDSDRFEILSPSGILTATSKRGHISVTDDDVLCKLFGHPFQLNVVYTKPIHDERHKNS